MSAALQVDRMILVKCRWCGADIGYVEAGARYELKCSSKRKTPCIAWTSGQA